MSDDTRQANSTTAELIRSFVRVTYHGDEEAAVWLLAAADTIERLTRERDGVAKTLELLLSESAPQIVPCVDHPVLDVIAARLANGHPDDHGHAEDVTRESECVEFRSPATGQRFEIIVRPIDDEEEDRP